jgi:hypothetical protein
MEQGPGWLGSGEATRTLNDEFGLGIEYHEVWRLVMRGEVRARRRGRLWEIEPTSLVELGSRLARERATAGAA